MMSFLVFLLGVALYGCGSGSEFDNIPTNIAWQDSVHEHLSDWGLYSNVEISNSADSAHVEVRFKEFENKEYGFFLDESSNNEIVSLLDYKLQEMFSDSFVVKYVLRFEGYPDVATYIIDENLRRVNSQRYESAPTYANLVAYSFEELGYFEVMKATQLIKYISDNAPQYFSYDRDYWSLLYDYCQGSKVPKGNAIKIYNYIVFAAMSRNEQYPYEIDISQEYFAQVIERNGHDPRALTMTPDEVTFYVKDLYQ